MNAKIGIMGIALGFAALANAGKAQTNKIVGTWKYQKSICQSGAIAKSPFADEDNQDANKSYIQIKFGEGDMSVYMSMSYRLNESKAKMYLEMLEQSLADAKQRPESESLRQSIAEMEKSRADLIKAARGFTCEVTQANKYSVKGEFLRIEQGPTQSTCGDAKSTVGEVNEQTFKIVGNVLQINSDQPVKSPKGSCPQGDYESTIYDRVN